MSNGNGSGDIWTRWMYDMVDEGAAHMRRMARLPFLWEQAQRVKKGATPSEVVYEEDRLKLLRYVSDTPVRYKTPLIFVFALVNRPYILDLKPGKSVVNHFVSGGFDTYLVDWGVPTQADRHLKLDDYINGYLMNVVRYVIEETGSPKVNILGYCMGGTMSSIFTAMHQRLVKNLILLAAGIDFSTREGMLNLWTDPKNYDVDKFIEAFGNCPAEFLQTSFLLLKPIQNLIEKPLNFYERLEDEDFVEDYFAMETWLNDNIPVAGEVYREFVKYLYQQNRLVKGRMPVGRHIVNLRDVTCPVLNLMAAKDDLVPCAQSRPFNQLVGSEDKEEIVFPAGHIGLAVGGKAQKELWPRVVQWLGQRSEARAATSQEAQA
ncbi:MAG: class III poly(R)-hydroxyalkanoic acid synthase subunit PhaC [Bacillota bacterium]